MNKTPKEKQNQRDIAQTIACIAAIIVAYVLKTIYLHH